VNAPLNVQAAHDGPRAARAALDAELARLDLLLQREILRLRARYELTLDEFRGLYISDRAVDELIRAARRGDADPSAEALTERARAILGERELAPFDAATPWAALARALCLSNAERDLVLLALAPELEPKYETLFAYLNNDVTRKLGTAELAGRLFADSVEERVALRGCLAPDAPLMALGILEFAPATRDAPRAQRGLRLAAPLVDWLQGLPYVSERLVGIARLSRQQSTVSLPSPHAAYYAAGDVFPVLVVTASSAEEAQDDADRGLTVAGESVLMLDLRALRSAQAPMEIGCAVEQMCALFGLTLLAAPLDAVFDAEGRPLEAPAAAMERLCVRARRVVLAGGASLRWREVVGRQSRAARAVELRLPPSDALQRAAAWRETLGPHAADFDVEALADRFALSVTRIGIAAQRAFDRAGFDGRAAPTQQELFEAARAASAEGAEGVVRQLPTPFSWDDLVVPPNVRQRLDDVVRAIELRPKVLDQWGFARRTAGARGVKVMFAGASGTGKTMAAAIVARALGLEVHRVQLASVVSKYIGETEKNLDRAFDAANRSNAVLFIDEADALFGKRSEVKDAHDRYANVETAYLLQKMEDHDGIVILATNLADNIDEAFSRRMHFVVEFPLPDAASRERLWRGMFPAEAPRAANVDFPFLARQFTLAGGDIRNIVLDAAYAAAQRSAPIAMGDLLRAVARQHEKRGKVPGASEFREYFDLLGKAADVERQD
jgi:SpoVK/Ycf46/Vps4 family AAA+-type ATPase